MANSSLIIFDGIEGSGKSTQVKFLAKKLKNKAVTLKEPGRKGVRSIIRKAILSPVDSLTEIFLFLADRRENYKQIKKLLKQKKIIILDRSFPSTLAYQLVGRGLENLIEVRDYMKLDRLARFNIEPSAVIILDLPPEVSFKRIRKEDRFEKEKLEFHKKVRRAYLKFAEMFKWKIFDGNKPAELLSEEIYQWLKKKKII